VKSIWRGCLAEAVGTFYLCFIGAGSICVNALKDGPGYGLIGIALAHGLALAIGVSATMAISGGQLNPAVSVSLWAARKIDGKRLAFFIVAQLLGAVVAGLLLRWIFPEYIGVKDPYYGVPGIGKDVGLGSAVAIEAILTFLLVFSVFGTAVDPRAPRIGGFGIGLTVAFDILVGGPLTGAAMNPARHLGIALVAGRLENWWVYWLGPIIGGVAAALLYSKLLMEEAKS
jgi:aquaporin TIP